VQLHVLIVQLAETLRIFLIGEKFLSFDEVF